MAALASVSWSTSGRSTHLAVPGVQGVGAATTRPAGAKVQQRCGRPSAGRAAPRRPRGSPGPVLADVVLGAVRHLLVLDHAGAVALRDQVVLCRGQGGGGQGGPPRCRRCITVSAPAATRPMPPPLRRRAAHLAAPGLQPAPQRQACEAGLVALEGQRVLQRRLQGARRGLPAQLEGRRRPACGRSRRSAAPWAQQQPQQRARTCASVDSATPEGARCLSVRSRLGSCCNIFAVRVSPQSRIQASAAGGPARRSRHARS